MNAIRIPSRLRAFQHIRLQNPIPRPRRYATEPAPAPPHPPSSPPNPNSNTPKEPSRVGAFYRTFSYPILKAFLGALFTYQLTYYAWMKLEFVEEKQHKQDEIEGLKEELKDVVVEQRSKARDMAAKVGEGSKGEVVVEDKGGKKGWGSWFR